MAAAAAAAASPGGAGVGEQPGEPAGRRQMLGPRFVYDHKNMSSPKVYVLQPWITNLLVNYEQMDANENLLAGQVLRVLSDSTAPAQPEVPEDAVLQVSDGSYYIRVVITPEALQAEENAHMQLRLSSLICRIIVLQKYTVCFREEAKLEDCEFYLVAQQFIVLPMERQRLESSDGNQEPSVMQKIKELWLRSLALKNAPSSEPSISQLIDAMGQDHLEVLKENAEKCLDLQMSKETPPAMMKDEVPVTLWEAERKKEQGEDVFMVPANILVIPPEEEAVACDASKADMCEAAPSKSGDERTVPGDPSVISQASSAESTALSESSEGSLENPWNGLPPISLTLNSSDERISQHDVPPKTQQDIAADSNTPDLLEQGSQDSAEGLLPGEPVQASSPSLLCSYGNIIPVETSITHAPAAMEAASDAPCHPQSPEVLRGSLVTPSSLSSAFSITPSSRLQPLSEGSPFREQADSSGTAFPPETLKCGLAGARTRGGGALGAKRKLMAGDDGQALPGLSRQQHPQGAPWGRGKETHGRLELVSTWHAKKSRKEERGLQHGKELKEEEEQAAPSSGPSSGPEQCRALQPYVKDKRVQYRYEAPSPELCEQIQSIRISKAMLKWACWILTDREVDS